MARARNIKPGFFKNEDLAELSADVRLLFIGLWTLADREGRLEDRPKRIKGELFPFEMSDVDSMLTQLQTSGFVIRYEVSGSRFLQVVNFVKHQDPHYKEKASEIPPPPGQSNLIEAVGITRETRARILERDGYKCRACGSEQYLSIDHVVPASRGGGSEDANLQVLCLKCNGEKGNKLPGEKKGTRRSKHASTSIRVRAKVEPKLHQDHAEHPGSAPLIPDSLIPDSLIPEEDSEPIGSAAVAAPPVGEDPKPKPEPPAALSAKDRLWALGVAILGEKARSFLGKAVATYGEDSVLDCLIACNAEQPGEPKGWLTKAFEARSKQQPKTQRANGNTRPTTEELLDREPRPAWVIAAGFEDIWQAESHGCGPGNAAKFREGKRLTQ